jgi:hypothetical protein
VKLVTAMSHDKFMKIVEVLPKFVKDFAGKQKLQLPPRFWMQRNCYATYRDYVDG